MNCHALHNYYREAEYSLIENQTVSDCVTLNLIKLQKHLPLGDLDVRIVSVHKSIGGLKESRATVS